MSIYVIYVIYVDILNLNVVHEGFHCLGPACFSSLISVFPLNSVFLLSPLALLLFLFPLHHSVLLYFRAFLMSLLLQGMFSPLSSLPDAILTLTNPLYLSINVNYARKWDVPHIVWLHTLLPCPSYPPRSLFIGSIILNNLFDFPLSLYFFICKMGKNH